MQNQRHWDFMHQFYDEFNRLFRSFIQWAQGLPSSAEVSILPRVDIFVRDEELVVEMEAPGMNPADFEVSVSRDLLVVEGHKENREKLAKGNYLCMERDFGRFRRVVELLVPCNTGAAKAELKNGVLRVRLPKVEERRGTRRPIPIEYVNNEESHS